MSLIDIRPLVMPPKVTISVSVHNTVNYLNVFFDCLFSQTYPNLEIIIVDDGSTDGSLEIIKRNALKDNRICFLQTEKHITPDEAHQLTFEKATGKYIIPLDSDDYFPSNYVQALVVLAEQFHLDFAVAPCQRIDESGQVYGKKISASKQTTVFFNEKEKLALLKTKYGGWSRLVKKDFLIQWGYDYSQMEMPLFFLQFYKSAKVGFSTDTCYFYRSRRDSISRKNVAHRFCNLQPLFFLDWLPSGEIDEYVFPRVGLFAIRMVFPYIFYKHAVDKDYDYKKDIKLMKQMCSYSFWKSFCFFKYFNFKDKVMLFFFMNHCYGIISLYISLFRS